MSRIYIIMSSKGSSGNGLSILSRRDESFSAIAARKRTKACSNWRENSDTMTAATNHHDGRLFSWADVGWHRRDRTGEGKERLRTRGRGIQAGVVQRPRRDASCDFLEDRGNFS